MKKPRLCKTSAWSYLHHAASRAASVYWGIPNYLRAYTATHDRIDSLFFGVLLGHLYHFRPLVLERLTRSTVNRLAIAGVSVLSLSSAYFLSRDTRVFSVFGFSFLYLGNVEPDCRCGNAAVTVSDSYVLARTYKSTDGALSHCKTFLNIAIVYLGVYHGRNRIARLIRR